MAGWLRSQWRSGLLPALGLAWLLLAALELRSPYYFLQDDGLEQHLPRYVFNLCSLRQGSFPLYNFHIFAGTPHFATGQSGVLYLPIYPALLLSRVVFGHYDATIDLLAWLHLSMAVAGMLLLLRMLGVRRTAAVVASLGTLSGFALWTGRSWPTELMLGGWFPWLLLLALRYLRRPSLRDAALLVAARTLLFFCGHPQYFVLALLFEAIFASGWLLVGARGQRWTRLRRYLLLYVPTLLACLPLLLPMMRAAALSVDRSSALPYLKFSELTMTPLAWLFGQLFAFYQLHFTAEGITQIPYQSYLGVVPTLLSAYAAVALWRWQPRRRRLALLCLGCCVLALLWCWNLLGPVLYHVPVLNRFRWPFKLVYFSGFFQLMLAALVLDRMTAEWRRFCLALVLLSWIAMFLVLPTHAWRVRPYRVPIESPWAQQMGSARYLFLARKLDSNHRVAVQEPLLGFDYAELWNGDNLLGYEPLLSRDGAPGGFAGRITDYHTGAFPDAVDAAVLDRFRSWGVRYYVVDPDDADVASLLPPRGLHLVAQQQGWQLWQDPLAAARVRWSHAPSAPVPLQWQMGVNTLAIAWPGAPPDELTVAYTNTPGFVACTQHGCAQVPASADGMMHLRLPSDVHAVQLEYRDPLFAWGLRSAALGGLALVGLYLLRWRALGRA